MSHVVVNDVGSCNDHISTAGKTTITNWCRPKLDVVCVVDLHRSQHQAGREKVLEDVRFACHGIPGAVVHHIQFEKLDYGESNALDKFYNSEFEKWNDRRLMDGLLCLNDSQCRWIDQKLRCKMDIQLNFDANVSSNRF